MKDLKYGWLGGTKVDGKPSKTRYTEDGKPYQIIFFRKGTPQAQNMPAMSTETYQAARNAFQSSASNLRIRGIGGALNTVNELGLKQRVLTKKPARLTGTANKEHEEGMVRTGSAKHHAYGTFRKISQNSKAKWIIPAIKKTPIFSKLVEDMRGMIQDNMREALAKDLLEREKMRLGL